MIVYLESGGACPVFHKVLMDNLAIAFPEKSEEERKQLARLFISAHERT
jgi:lauroyl/myristoyl acyltransferase